MQNFIKQQPIYVIVLAVLTLALVGFIWFNSAEPKPASKEKSATVTEALRPVVEPVVGKKVYGVNFVRKAAHVAEYSALGFLVSLTFLSAKTRAKTRKKLIIAPIFCLSVAAVDEIIQIFSGRGPLISDVLLDLAAASVSIMLVFLVRYLHKKFSEKT